jgi:uncharacterized protein (TIGR04255 family)
MPPVKGTRFSKPPLREAILGVQYPMTEGVGGFVLGGFWPRVADRFSKLHWRLPEVPGPPCKLVSSNEDYVLQILDSGFYLSWVKSENGSDYPEFSSLLEVFQGFFVQFQTFLHEIALPGPSVTALTMGFTNIVEKPADAEAAWLTAAFPDFCWRPGHRSSPPRFVSFLTQFENPEVTGDSLVARIEGPYSSSVPAAEHIRFLLEATKSMPSVEEFGANAIPWDWYLAAKRKLNQLFLDLTDSQFRLDHWGEGDIRC